jgi:type IV pilus assembly protein PilY1
VLLWEFKPATATKVYPYADDDMGYSYGNPVITAKADGTWVVLLTSGYNNTSPGNGQGYLYVLRAGTGEVISKIGTGVGSTTTPSGLSKISAWNDSPSSNRASFVYGGDLLGNLWRFDINSAGTPFLLANLRDDTLPSGIPQPITTVPVLGKILGKRVIFVGTGKYLENSDLSDTQLQSLYAIKDDNATVTLTNPGGSPRNSTTLVQQTLTQGAGVRTASTNPVDFSTDLGWYVDFPDTGERSNIESRLVQGTLLVATIVPSNSVCSPGGYGWLNFFDYLTGSSIDSSNIVSASYSNTIVGINVLYINGQPVIETVTSNDPTPTVNTDVLIKGTASGFTGKRVLWRELNPQ